MSVLFESNESSRPRYPQEVVEHARKQFYLISSRIENLYASYLLDGGFTGEQLKNFSKLLVELEPYKHILFDE